MAYRAYQPDRRRRRRRLLLILLTTVLVIAAIAFLVSRQTEQRGTVEFLAAADDASMQHAAAASLFTETLAEIGPLMPRQEVNRRLTTITEGAEAAHAALEIEVPMSVGSSWGSLVSASESWVDGTAEVQRVILGIMDGEIVTAPEVALRNALDTLRVGDVGYQRFLDEVGGFPEDVTVPEFPSVAYIDPDQDDPFLYDAQNLALKIVAAYNLAPRHDLGVVGSTDPAAVGERGGIPLVAFAEALTVNAVVSNIGNEDESGIEVVLDLLDVDSGDTFTRRSTVTELAAGASTTVAFTDLPIHPDGLYQAVLSVTIEGDAQSANDSWASTFIWNGES